MAFIITEPCIDTKDRSCVEVCPVDCIYDNDAWESLLIHPTECIDCALCVEACPVQAIYEEKDVPEWWRGWIDKAYAAFDLERPAPSSAENEKESDE